MGQKTSKNNKIEAVSGEKKAVLIGLRHLQINTDVKGSILRMKKNLMELHGFSEDNIILMIQDEPSYTQPTESNIRYFLWSLVLDANPFDTLFIHLIAHGPPGLIVSADQHRISGKLFGDLLMSVDNGCTLTMLLDCLKIEPAEKLVMPSWNVKISDQVEERRKSDQARELLTYLVKNPQEDDENQTLHQRLSQMLKSLIPDSRGIILISVQCVHKGVVAPSTTTLYGGFSNAVLDVIEETRGRVTNLELAQKAMEKLRMQGIHQRLVLGCSDHHQGYADSFLS